MRKNYTDMARVAVELAEGMASKNAGGHVGAEHILIGVLSSKGSVAEAALLALGVDVPTMRLAAEEAVGRDEARASGSTEYNVEAAAVLDAAEVAAGASDNFFIGTDHLLMGLTGESAGRAARILRDSGVELASAQQGVTRILTQYTGGPDAASSAGQAVDDSPRVVRAKIELSEVRSARYEAIGMGSDEEALRLRAREKEIRYDIKRLRDE